jgi:hypothetical protein
MAEERPGETDPVFEEDQQDDVVGKIDQLLNRHRPKSSAPSEIPVLTKPSQLEDVPTDDGIPILTDIVAGPGQSAVVPSGLSRSNVISSTLILRRMAVALEAEQARLLAQMGNDAAQARMLERLVAELKRALPAAVRAAITDKTSDPAVFRNDSRL